MRPDQLDRPSDPLVRLRMPWPGGYGPRLRVTLEEDGYRLTTANVSQAQANRLISLISRQLEAEGKAARVRVEADHEAR